MAHNKAPRQEQGSDKRDILTSEEKAQAVKMIGAAIYAGHGKNGLRLVETGSVGAGDSAHDVFFANADPARDMAIAPTVAIKRFRRAESAQAELDNLAEINRRGLRTVTPTGQGLYDLGSLGTALVTDFVPQFTTMNRIGWGDFVVGHPGYDNLAKTLEEVGAFAGQLHAAGVVHNDLQIKNVGRAPLIIPGQPARITPVVFDVEGAKFFDPTADPDSQEGVQFAGSCLDEMNKLVGSLVGRRFLAGSHDRLFEQEISSHLLEPYFDNGGNPELLERYDAVMGDAIELRHMAPSLSPAEVGKFALL